jgi:formylglycine-generating enzyme required for sulfatase activity/TolB-like protein
MKRFLLFMLLVSSVTFAGSKVAVLDLKNDAGVSSSEIFYLTDRTRDAVMRKLPARFNVMTSESILELLPPGVKMADCSDAECEVEIGRKLGAEYVITGELLTFANKYRLNLKLHHCESASFLGSETIKGSDLEQLEESIIIIAGELGTRIGKHAGASSSNGRFQAGNGNSAPEDSWFMEVSEKAVVKFESDPAGAVVVVDGKIIMDNSTPVATPFSREIEAGLVTVSMQKDRYLTREQMVDIKTGNGTVNIDWKLDPNFGWITISTKPSGIEIKIDNQSVGKSPISSKELTPGGYKVSVSDEQYYIVWENVEIARGQKKNITLKPEPIEGGLKVSAKDKQGNALSAKVEVDGKSFGTTPCSGKLLVGKHSVETSFEGYSSKDEVVIKERDTEKLDVVLNKKRNKTSSGSSNIEMVEIQAGSFMMGSPSNEKNRNSDEKKHKVTIRKSFLMSKTEVTQKQWQAVMGNNPSYCIGDDNPVERVSWFNCVKFCNKLSEKEGLEPVYNINGNNVTWDKSKRGYRLPTEAEWEYACRAGTTTRFNTGNSDSDLKRAGWFKDNSGRKSHPVAQKTPNSYGLYDMHGNVWEWCWDWFGSYGGDITADPVGASSGSYRVFRGGAWYNDAQRCRSAYRNNDSPNNSYHSVGFRFVRSTGL